jgi:ribonuclease P protein component
MREEDLSTEQPEAQEDPRLSGSYAHSRRAGGSCSPAPQGARPAIGLIWRVRDRATFRALVAGRRHFRGALTMTCVRSAESGPPRVAYAVPRSVGNAVVRNRVRRRLRDLVRRHAAELRDGHAYLIGASARAADATFVDLDGALSALLLVAEPSR